MNIIKKNYRDVTDYEIKKNKANEGCEKCPNCGEIKNPYMSHSDEGSVLCGIQSNIITYKKMHSKTEVAAKTMYRCFTCGCIYMSDEYTLPLS